MSKVPVTPTKAVQYMATLALSEGGSIGGIENHVLTLCEHFDPTKIESIITCPAVEERGELLQRASLVGVRVLPFPTPGRDFLSHFRRVLALAALLRRERAEVFHIHTSGFAGFNAFLSAIIARVPNIIVTHHSWPKSRPDTRAGRLMFGLEKRYAARIIVLNAAQVSDLTAAGVSPEGISIVPNGVDLGKFQRQHNDHAAEPSVFRLAMVSRLVEGKGHIELVRAVASLADRFPGLRLMIVGDGPTRPDIGKEIVEHGLEAKVELVGQVSNALVPDLLRTCDALAFPSYCSGETFGIVLIEGMAMGLPVVATRFGGIPEVVADGETGLLVEPRDVAALAAAIEQLINDPAMAREMGQKGMSRAERLFSAGAVARSLTAIYTELASAKGRVRVRRSATTVKS